jgi:hypothetical protein
MTLASFLTPIGRGDVCCRACGRSIAHRIRASGSGRQMVYCHREDNPACHRKRNRDAVARHRAIHGNTPEPGRYGGAVEGGDFSELYDSYDDESWQDEVFERVDAARAQSPRAQAVAFARAHRHLYTPGCRVVRSKGRLELRGPDGRCLASQ